METPEFSKPTIDEFFEQKDEYEKVLSAHEEALKSINEMIAVFQTFCKHTVQERIPYNNTSYLKCEVCRKVFNE